MALGIHLGIHALLAALLLAAVAGTGAQDLTQPPGGLSPSDTPQFILLTHDDAVDARALELMTSLLGSRQSANGCKAAATFFTQFFNTDCTLLKQMYDDGLEVATHTINHPHTFGLSYDDVSAEVVGARNQLSSTCGIPETDIVGFRSPYLETSATHRQVLQDSGFLYDSSVIEAVRPRQSLSQGRGGRIWPYSLANGFPSGINCAWTLEQECSSLTTPYTGLWEVPVWQLLAGDEADASRPAFTMDYGNENSVTGDTYAVLKESFEAAYAGNRAPLPIYIHSATPWHTDADGTTRAQAVARFLDEALAQPNVYMVTMRQLLAWMQNPMPASQLTPEALGCGSPGGAPGSGGTVPLDPLSPGSPSEWIDSPSPSSPASEEPESPPPEGDDPCTYTLAEGDMLGDVADSAGLTLDELLALNSQITNPDEVVAGDPIAIC